MYAPHGFNRLDTPPPGSQFRRPWSPETNDQLSRGQNQRREPSDVSVEALDLADYARTLNMRTNNHQADDPFLASYSSPYITPAFRAYEQYPPSPPLHRPLASRDSLPSLASPSASSSQSHASTSRSPPLPHHRPFSLPPPSSYAPHYPLHSHPSYSSRDSSRLPNFNDLPPTAESPQSEIDIAHFPSFTRGWYQQEQQQMKPDDPFTSLHGSEPHIVSPFNPGYISNAWRADQYGYHNYSPPPSYPYFPSHGSRSSRDVDVLPWSADPPESAPPLDPDIKEERVRMLEREFGKKGKGTNESGETLVGSVNAKGRLITEGPKKRLATRWIQVLLALLAGGASIYAAAIIKPPTPAPPSGKPQAYVLYVLSVLTFLFSIYFFIIYPSCCGPRKATKDSVNQGPAGMMVLPIQTMPGGKKAKKNKKGGGSDGVQVNLIVDPGMFGGNQRDDDLEEEGGDGSEPGIPGSFSGGTSSVTRRTPRRRGVFEGLAIEARWKRARRYLKQGMAVDMVCMVLWGAEFVYIMLGKRCPAGGFNGWCDAYNLSTAAACLLCFAFGFSVFFDIKDLHASRASPRTRT
ncbi:hypothetical protein C8Q75DRAFT_801577 [Abortiporus biennis]|nr:hypothetical protein C8Q75DRAFT_801577 [Abortiporus biennis]